MSFFDEAFKTWNRMLKLSLTANELLITSGQTISHRTNLMGNNIASPQNIEDEVSLMSDEKIQAISQSSSALLDGYFRFNQQLMASCSNSFLTTYQGLLFTPLAPQSTEQHLMSYWDTLNHSAMETLGLTNTALAVIEESLHPIHSRTSSNAKRLQS